jgi:hypothetical protein
MDGHDAATRETEDKARESAEPVVAAVAAAEDDDDETEEEEEEDDDDDDDGMEVDEDVAVLDGLWRLNTVSDSIDG